MRQKWNQMNKKTVCFTYLTALIIAELIDVSYLSSLTEKHSEDSVWRRHHQQRRLSGEFEEINGFLPSCFLLVCPSHSREPDMSRIHRGNVFKLETFTMTRGWTDSDFGFQSSLWPHITEY